MQRVLNQQQPLRLNQALHIQSMASKKWYLAIRIYRSRLVCHTSILLAYTNIYFLHSFHTHPVPCACIHVSITVQSISQHQDLPHQTQIKFMLMMSLVWSRNTYHQVINVTCNGVEIKSLNNQCIVLDCIGNADDFTRVVLEDAKTFRPIGEKVHEYSREGDQGQDEHFEIYKVKSLGSKVCSYILNWDMWDRHHSVIPSFENTINACNSLYYYTLKDQVTSRMMTRNGRYTPCEYKERCGCLGTLMLIMNIRYRREHTGDSEMYHFVGYATVYPFFYWPENTRMRIRYVLWFESFGLLYSSFVT